MGSSRRGEFVLVDQAGRFWAGRWCDGSDDWVSKYADAAKFGGLADALAVAASTTGAARVESQDGAAYAVDGHEARA